MPEAVKKLSMKTVCGDYKKYAKRLKEENLKSLDLYTMIGCATGFETGTSDKGDWTALVGEFEAVNIETGEAYTGLKCFLPKDITGYFISGMKSTPNGVCEFAVKVVMKPNDSIIGFEYAVQPLVPLKASGTLNKLRAEASKALPPAPATETLAKKGK